MLIFRQLFDPPSSTYTYLLGDRASREAVLIDPVFEQARRDAALIARAGPALAWTLETHVHADHVTGAWLLRQRLRQRASRVSRGGGADRRRPPAGARRPHRFGKRHLAVRATPGHTGGCLTYVLDDQSTRLHRRLPADPRLRPHRLPAGRRARAVRVGARADLHAAAACLLYPAHDYGGLTVTSVGEERRFNPRLGGEISEDDFVGYMSNLGLPHPKQIDVAVPANLRCGQPDGGRAARRAAMGAAALHLRRHVGDPAARAGRGCRARADRRRARAATSSTARSATSRTRCWIPLGELASAPGELARDRPVVAVCRSGARSAQAARCSARPASTRSPTWPAACCAGGSRAVTWSAAAATEVGHLRRVQRPQPRSCADPALPVRCKGPLGGASADTNSPVDCRALASGPAPPARPGPGEQATEGRRHRAPFTSARSRSRRSSCPARTAPRSVKRCAMR